MRKGRKVNDNFMLVSCWLRKNSDVLDKVVTLSLHGENFIVLSPKLICE